MHKAGNTKALSPALKFIFVRLFPLLFIVAGAGLAYHGIHEFMGAKDSTKWPVAEGRVIASSITLHQDDIRHRDRVGDTYHAKIQYEFSVEGITYRGNRIAAVDYGMNDPAHARRLVQRYPEGKVVQVHYKPGDPEVCLLKPGIQKLSWLMPGAGLAFFLAGIIMAAFLPMLVRRQEHAMPGENDDNWPHSRQ